MGGAVGDLARVPRTVSGTGSSPRSGAGGHVGAAPSFGTELAGEYRRLFRPPFEMPAIMVGNGILLVLAWFLLPQRIEDWLFSRHGPLAFPIFLGAWMIADTPATNILAWDTTRSLELLSSPERHLRWLLARSVAIGSVVAVPCVSVAAIVGFRSYPAGPVLWTCLVLLVLPICVLPMSSWLGILLPYHRRPLLWRWEKRKVVRRQLRWATLALAPFVMVPMIGTIVLTPSVAAGTAFAESGERLSTLEFAVSALIACGMSGLIGLVGVVVALHLLKRRAARLADYLRDHELG